MYNFIDNDKNQTYTLSSNFDYTVPSHSTLTLILTTQNISNGTEIPFTVNEVECVDLRAGNFVINNNIGTVQIPNLISHAESKFNITLDFLGVSKCFLLEAATKFMTYNINVDFDVTNIPVTAYPPDGNVNDIPRITTFREDGQYFKYLSAGGTYEDAVTHVLSVPPWGSKNIVSTNSKIETISGNAGTTCQLKAGVDVFVPSNNYLELTPDITNWEITSNPNDTKYRILYNTDGTKDVNVKLYPADAQVWTFSTPGTNTMSWIISSDEPLRNTYNWADGSAREVKNNNAVATHTFTGNASFSGVRYSNPDRIRKFASRLGGGSFPTNTYAAGGNIDLSLMPRLSEYTIEEHNVTFSNFNSVNTQLIRFQHWNNNTTGMSFDDLDLSRLPVLQVFSVRGSSNTKRGNFTGNLHSNIPSTLFIYNGKYNNLTGNLPTFTTNFSNMRTYHISENLNITGELKSLVNLGSNRSSQDVEFLSNRTQLSTVASNFTINSKIKKINLLGNSFSTTELNKIVLACANTTVSNCSMDLRANPGATVTDTASVTTLTNRGWTIQF